MVLFAMISRVSDGMAMSASTDLDMHFELKESKKQAKTLARKANQFPIKCWMRSGNHNIYFIKAVGVCFLAVCEMTYPTVLAFCFLDEIQREFMVTFQSQDVQRAKRPYSFIEFDTFIQKTKQRYNNTRTLTTRINVSEMSEELQNFPPYNINSTELGPLDVGVELKTYKTGGPARKLQPLSWVGLTICMLSAVCALLNFLRCLPFLSFVSIDDESSSKTASSAVAFFLAGLLNCLQCYLLLFAVKWRIAMSRTCFAIIIILIYYLNNLRNFWQILFHVMVAMATLHRIAKRQLQEKPPDYNV
ncbi:vesicle-trafficking protein SEC22a [Nematostella vectensis]|uniref:vesicle-trafficking protein SEC22a n=1 Tax=Nematostella vectensis TaxID=45351 RepID=UPI0013903A9E|nr:vesicle-trafficking protein SEC22a [Nematostella vectensis]